ncbi:unnamed protein product [Penicillium olsonii]|uniref:Uncharacterized protein n=1 Tax=Penicillium olsonii TaxID=99116 RepID=A0A9W4HH77_PENOL|nr:unnamed protein product [Penicillium olsonii]
MQTFQTNCTLPPGRTIFVSSPNTRGTLDILWPCLSLLILCTWSILRLNVPTKSAPGITKSQWYRREIFLFMEKLQWMIISLFAPEIILGQAWGNRRSAILLENQFEKYKREDNVPWSRSHIYYANMGGFPIQFIGSMNRPNMEPYNPNTIPGCLPRRHPAWFDSDTLQIHSWTFNNPPSGYQPLPQRARNILERHIRESVRVPMIRKSKLQALEWTPDYLNAKNAKRAISIVSPDHFTDEKERQWFLTFIKFWVSNVVYLCGDIWVLDANQLLLARKLGIIKRLPSLSNESLNDRNKNSLIITILALGQIIWLLIQIIIRLAQDLPTSQLELLTLAFAVCSVFTYILLFNKPKDVQTSHTINAVRRPSTEELILIANAGPTAYMAVRQRISIPHDAIHQHTRGLDQNQILLLGCALASIPFGAIHCIAWNFEFPTEAERICWHIASIITVGAFPLIFVFSCGFETLEKSKKNMPSTRRKTWKCYLSNVFFVMIALTGGSYVIARLFMTVEAFRSLAFLPGGAFSATWSAGIPHFG